MASAEAAVVVGVSHFRARRLVGRHGSEGHVDGHRRAVPDDRELDRLLRPKRRDPAGEIVRIGDRLAVDRGDDVAALHAGGGGGQILLRRGHQRAARLLEAEVVGQIRGHILNLDADPAARDRAVLLELLHDVLDDVAGDGEADADAAARRREDRGVDAHHLAFGVEGRAAGIAVIDRRVDLQEVVIGPGADVASARRDDAGGHRSAEAERVADRDHPIADARRVRGERDIGEIGALSLQKRKVGFAVDADHLGGHRLAVGGGDGHFRGMVDDMVIGDDVAVGRNEESGALRLREMMARRAVAVSAPSLLSGMPKWRKK